MKTASLLKSMTALAALAAVGSSPVFAAGEQTAKIWTVNYDGRPPFSRSVEELPVTDVARLEAAGAEVVEVRTVDYSGRPPYKRGTETLRVIDSARLEPGDENESRPRFMGKPPFHR